MDTSHIHSSFTASEYKTGIVLMLNSLLRYVNDGVLGYENALKNVSSLNLKLHFEKFLEERKKYSIELQTEIEKLGGREENLEGEILGFFHRLWMDVSLGLTSNEELSILKSAQTGDTAALDLFKESIEGFKKFNYNNSMILHQYSGIERALSEVNNLISGYEKV